MRTRARTLSALAISGVAALGLTACGSSSSSSAAAPETTTTAATTAPATTAPAAGGGGSNVTLTADPNGGLSFNTTTLSAKAGTVTITMDNPSSSGVPHAIAVEGNGVDKDGATADPGSNSTVTVSLKPGTYTFYCPVPGHEAAGMKGTLTVS